MAGGKVGPFFFKDNQEENETPEFVTISSNGDGFISRVSGRDSSGGAALSTSYLFNGVTWVKASAMPTQRVGPVCSLLEMDDGEVT